MSERPKGKSGHLEELHSERDADDGDAEKQAHQSIVDADQNASEQQPENIAYEFHNAIL